MTANALSELETNEALRNRIDKCYLVGEKSDCLTVMYDLEDNYGYSIERTWIGHTLDNMLGYLIFALALILILIYCYMDASFEKKEISIRILHGDSPLTHYIRFSLTDTLVFSALFAALYLLQSQYTDMLRFHRNAYLLFLPFLLGIWLVNLHLLRINPKEILYGHRFSQRLLFMLSGLGKVTGVLCCVVILIMLSLIPSLRKYQRAEDFFADKKDYVFLATDTGESSDEMDSETKRRNFEQVNAFYRESDEVLAPICMMDISNELMSIYESSTEAKTIDWGLMYCNHRALPYIQSVIPQAQAVNLDTYDVAILVPDILTAEETELAKAILLEDISSSEGYRPAEDCIQSITYTADAELLSFYSAMDSEFNYLRTPALCIVSNTYQRADAASLNIRHDSLWSGSISRITDPQVLNDIAQTMGFTAKSFSVYDKFQIDYQVQKTLILLSLVISLLLIVFYVSVLRTVLQLDYQVNALALAIQKTLGDSMLQKNARHFIGAILVGIVNLIAAVVYANAEDVTISLPLLLLVPIVLLALHFALLYFLIVRIEKQQIVKILKGGAL